MKYTEDGNDSAKKYIMNNHLRKQHSRAIKMPQFLAGSVSPLLDLVRKVGNNLLRHSVFLD